MLSVKILGLVVSFFIVYSMPTEKKPSESWEGPLSNKKEESNAFYKGGAKSNTTKDYDGTSSTSTTYVISPYQITAPQPIELYKFDYLIRSPNGDLQFREESGFRNGTVKGFYGHYEHEARYIIVSYTADANGYHADVEKAESTRSRTVGLSAGRGHGGIRLWRFYLNRYVPFVGPVVYRGFQYENDSSTTEDSKADEY